jgi:ATP-binding cassette, subfamily C (CFTR/MRP), member 4
MNHTEQQKLAESPQVYANRFSKMTFWWIRDLFRKGLTQTITEQDIYQTNADQESAKIGDKFTKLWDDELQRQNPSVLRMFYRAYGPSVLTIGFLFSICESIMRAAQPLFLGALLTYFADQKASRNEAYLYGFGITLCSLIPVITYHPFVYYAIECAMKVRIGSSRLIYDKVSCLKVFLFALKSLNFFLL